MEILQKIYMEILEPNQAQIQNWVKILVGKSKRMYLWQLKEFRKWISSKKKEITLTQWKSILMYLKEKLGTIENNNFYKFYINFIIILMKL